MAEASLVIFPALTINFALFNKHVARLATTLIAQVTSNLIQNETLVDAPHKAAEKALTVYRDKWPASDVLES